MSKASEWAEELRRRNREQAPIFETQFSYERLSFMVSDGGSLRLPDNRTVTAKDALAFAKWIEETFG